MAFTLHRLLRQLKVSVNRSISSESYNTRKVELPLSDVKKISVFGLIQKQENAIPEKIPAVNFTPISLNLNSNSNYFSNVTTPSISSRIIKCPVLTNLEIIEPPKTISIDNIENFPTISLELPTPRENVVEKQAARLLKIRKNKMKTHKLRKLRKKMKFEWAKVRQRREMKKEKLFQAELIAQIKKAEQFDATHYVAEKIRRATEVPIPRFWKGKRLPQFIIKQKLGLDKE